MNKERPATNTEEGETLLTSAQAAAQLGITEPTLRQWRTKGRGPDWLKLGDSQQALVRYRRSDIAEWEARHHRPSADAQPTP